MIQNKYFRIANDKGEAVFHLMFAQMDYNAFIDYWLDQGVLIQEVSKEEYEAHCLDYDKAKEKV